MMRRAVLIGLAFGVGAVHIAAVGVLLAMHQRWIIVDVLSLGQGALLLIAGGAGATAGRPLSGLLAGAAAGVPIAALVVLMSFVPLHAIFIALSPDLLDMLTLNLGISAGVGILIGGAAIAGVLGAALRASPTIVRRAIFPGAIAVAVAGVFQELIQLIFQQYEGPIGDFRDFLYTWEGLTPQGAVTIFILTALCSEVIGSVWRRRVARMAVRDHRRERMVRAGIALLVLALLPAVAGSYIGQVLMLVGLYILMGMGLNLEVGLAGLLDLGFVAFFAVGAYTTALLTADASHALAHLSYWAAMPVAVFLSIIVGVLFGLPGTRRARRLSSRRDAGPGRDRACHRAIGFRLATARRRAGNPANPQTATGRFRTPQPGVAVLSDLGRLRGRGVRRLAAGELASRSRLDGAAR